MYCKNCGKEMNETQDYCLACGVKKGNGNAFCSNCGNSVNPNADVCVNCGTNLKKNDFIEGELAGQNKILIALLCFFLGGIGIHNFVMGETKKGIFKIVMSFLCGIGSILALIDFIKILCNKYVVDPTKLV